MPDFLIIINDSVLTALIITINLTQAGKQTAVY